MRILAFNCGSSTLKFQLIEMGDGNKPAGQEHKLASGTIDKIGDYGTIDCTSSNGSRLQENTVLENHAEAVCRVLGWLDSQGLLENGALDAVGHRVVHGGYRFTEPTLISDEVIDGIEEVSQLAPLHNIPSLSTIRAAKKELGHTIPQVAVFDTSFYCTLPERASRYAIPLGLAEEHHIRRYGFHGLAHQYMTERYVAICDTTIDKVDLITLQLGNGCSATAVKGGQAIDTSMGFTPLEGLIMGTRSGDIDPSLIGFLARQMKVGVEDVEDLLNTNSGLLGISGLSSDMRDILKAEKEGEIHAALAIDMFCYRVRKFIGAYLAVVGGAEAVVFGGGIGEGSPLVRARICSGMEWCGLILDENRNANEIKAPVRISSDDSRIHVYVIPVDEMMIIARDTARCLY